MLKPERLVPALGLAALAALVLLCAMHGQPRPMTGARWPAIVIQAVLCATTLAWALSVPLTRAPGPVTRWLSCGLAGITLGSMAALLNGFIDMPASQPWQLLVDGASTLAGALALSYGLWLWRVEQFTRTAALPSQPGRVRDADALRDAIARQVQVEPHGACALVMLDLNNFHALNQEHGQHEGDRVLQAVCQLMLLNLGPDDLLCRFTGDRFAILMPGVDASRAQERARHLCELVACLRHYPRTGAGPLRVSARHVAQDVRGEPDHLIRLGGRALERRVYGQRGWQDQADRGASARLATQ
jgi:diguanylate cyclase (GGDEF)-like protein